MRVKLLRKLRSQARESVFLRPVYGDKIGIYNHDKWYGQDIYGSAPEKFETLEDALPVLQDIREEYVREAVERMRTKKLRKELEKY